MRPMIQPHIVNRGRGRGQAPAPAPSPAPEPVVEPTWSVNPSILSTLTEGASALGDPGVYSGTLPITPSYQWQEAETEAGLFSSIHGETTTTMSAPAAGDVGMWRRFRVSLVGPSGTAAIAYSDAQEVQAAAIGGGDLTYQTPDWEIATIDANGDPITILGHKVYWDADVRTLAPTYSSDTLAADATSYLIEDLVAGTYYYWPVTITSAGESDRGAPQEFTV
jgi:hypothetical protein